MPKRKNKEFHAAPSQDERDAMNAIAATVNEKLLRFTAQLVIEDGVTLTAVYEDIAAEGIRSYPATIKLYKSAPGDIEIAKSILNPPDPTPSVEVSPEVPSQEIQPSTESIVDILTK